MDKIKLPKNFTLSRENMKDTLAAFKTNKSISNVAREVFQAAASVSSILPSVHALTPSLALLPMLEGSYSTAFRISVPPKTSAFSKALAAPKEAPKEPLKSLLLSASLKKTTHRRAPSL